MWKKLKIICIIVSVCLAVCCIPLKYTYKDGGSVSYKAVLYSYKQYHQIQIDGTFYEYNKFLFFPFNLFE